MWLEHADFVVDWHSTHTFLESFYPNQDNYGSGPKKLIIQYEPEYDCTLKQPTDITYLLRLGLDFKGLEIRFINDNYEDASYITRFVQYGRLDVGPFKDSALAAEAKRFWGLAIRECSVTSVVMVVDTPNMNARVTIGVSERFASRISTTVLKELCMELDAVVRLDAFECLDEGVYHGRLIDLDFLYDSGV
jgi:hypothetical protein